MSVVHLREKRALTAQSFLRQASIEVMPRTAEKIADFRTLLPKSTRIYIAHIDGTAIEDMVALAKRLGAQGFEVMPHIPARVIPSDKALLDWVKRYRDVGVSSALVLGGAPVVPNGPFESAIQLLETGVFTDHGFGRLHIAGHPEGNRDIESDGKTVITDEALRWKAAFAHQSSVDMAIVTQFVFDAAPLISWAERLQHLGVNLPIHAGIAGPAKLQTLIKYAIACGVGPSLKVLKSRAKDISQLVRPHEPTEMVSQLATYINSTPNSAISALHLFPLGGIAKSASLIQNGASSRTVA
ncbi:MAG: methylenetetrahydrofolate reductase [Maritimibacter sp.]